MNDTNNPHRGKEKMGSIEIVAIVKMLWVAFIPALMKGWNILEGRFKMTEDRISKVEAELHSNTTELRVLVERSENQEKSMDRIETMLETLTTRR